MREMPEEPSAASLTVVVKLYTVSSSCALDCMTDMAFGLMLVAIALRRTENGA